MATSIFKLHEHDVPRRGVWPHRLPGLALGRNFVLNVPADDRATELECTLWAVVTLCIVHVEHAHATHASLGLKDAMPISSAPLDAWAIHARYGGQPRISPGARPAWVAYDQWEDKKQSAVSVRDAARCTERTRSARPAGPRGGDLLFRDR